MYDAELGRWFTKDPCAEMYLSYSPYNYTLNNPINYLDPNGMWVDKGDRWTTDDPDEIAAFFGTSNNSSDGAPEDEEPEKKGTGMPSYIDNLSKAISSLFTINLNPFSEDSKKEEAKRQENVQMTIVILETVNGYMTMIVPMSSVAELMAHTTSEHGTVTAGIVVFALVDMATLGKGGNVKKISQVHAFASKFENLYKAGKIDALNKEQAKQLIKYMKDLGMEYKVHRPHLDPKNPWKVPHINIGKKHVPIKFD